MLQYSNAIPASEALELDAVCPYLLNLMLRNVATVGWVLRGSSGRRSLPGCVIASPSHPSYPPLSVDVTDQDYVFHWTRDAAVVAIELTAWPGQHRELLNDYAMFVAATQRNCPSYGFACFRVDATPRDGSDPMELRWSEQSDGPALRVVSLVRAWQYLSSQARTAAEHVIRNDVTYLLSAYRQVTRNLWEETVGFSFFARAVQCESFSVLLQHGAPEVLALLDNQAIQAAIADLKALLVTHWDGTRQHYIAVLNPSGSFGADLDAGLVMASIYGAIASTDARLLATAAQLRHFFTAEYRINAADAAEHFGPLIGRYPGDIYDGDWSEPNIGHPWILCSCNFAELYYRVAAEIARTSTVVIDATNAPFFADFGIDSNTPAGQAVARLCDGGDAVLRAIIRHSDHLELSEQYDRDTGYEKSVRNLSWSYASYLSAIRARSAIQA